MKNQEKILLVEDDQNFGSVLKAYLEMFDYLVTWVDDGKDAVKTFNETEFSICVLDVMLPNVDGFTIAENIRKLNKQVPFIFLTAKTLKEDILRGYSTGADDYLTKPFDSEILLCKIDAILKRNGNQSNLPDLEEFLIGKLSFNYKLRILESGENKINLSPKESDLLKLLCQHKNEILPRDLALKSIWGDDSYFTTRSMDVYITKLRKYLKSEQKVQIVNVHGNGYRLIIPE
ncbi:MAG TPA: response regulator transcription factor [Bacteroidales bacterium]|nr:response regulator transcription factor [Bacteroidales bacterium]HPE56776.1 response regulator transcription factor [Bacteroidales bacterium]HRX96861.1 response regulator transcription factor [Bacteroidales bacterium]